jgi:hypothetical protein
MANLSNVNAVAAGFVTQDLRKGVGQCIRVKASRTGARTIGQANGIGGQFGKWLIGHTVLKPGQARACVGGQDLCKWQVQIGLRGQCHGRTVRRAGQCRRVKRIGPVDWFCRHLGNGRAWRRIVVQMRGITP